MGQFILHRLGMMILAVFCLTFIVFFLTNLYPNLEKVAKHQGHFRMSDEQVTSWLKTRGYLRPTVIRYGEWLGVVPKFTNTAKDGTVIGGCNNTNTPGEAASRFCGVLQGYWGYSTVFKKSVSSVIGTRLALTGKMVFWVMLLLVPSALLIGILAGINEGSKTDRVLSTVAITTTATPEYVSGVILIAVFSSSAVGLKWFKGTATMAMENANFENFLLPVLTITLYAMGYIARMTRASMIEVMTSQYIPWRKA